jgi:hypothetical protein
VKQRIIAVIVLTAVLAVGWALLFGPLRARGKPVAGLKNPEKLVLYSINGTRDSDAAFERAKAVGKETFRNYAVLGKLPVTDAAKRRDLVAVLQDSIVNHDGAVMTCFFPRHAIIAEEDGRHFEIIICFECQNYTMNDDQDGGLISRRAEKPFNDLLKQAGVAIAP